MPWYLFGRARATRHGHIEQQYSAAYWRVRHDVMQNNYEEALHDNRVLSDQIVRLRRELDSARNHVSLQGVVFNGEVL